jgi:glycosyltransferase involved in cell wall biosynthesis
MIKRPDISVVMGVYNGADHLRESMDSILSQEGVSLELIVVNDGSTDDSGRILDEYARRDRRVRAIHQENRGLTRALISGCAEAQGKYIARNDCGDISLPRRFARQLACIKAHPEAALVSCGTRFVGPGGELLYDVNHDPSDATKRLLAWTLSEIRGPSHHGSTLFPRERYLKAGGYREAFYFAQDLDLWIRLVQQGEHIILPELLYQASVTVGALSGQYRNEQLATTHIIFESARLRRRGLDDSAALEKACSIHPVRKRTNRRRQKAQASYFIGMCLKNRGDQMAIGYFKEAVKLFPFHLKAWWRLLTV